MFMPLWFWQAGGKAVLNRFGKCQSSDKNVYFIVQSDYGDWTECHECNSVRCHGLCKYAGLWENSPVTSAKLCRWPPFSNGKYSGAVCSSGGLGDTWRCSQLTCDRQDNTVKDCRPPPSPVPEPSPFSACKHSPAFEEASRIKKTLVFFCPAFTRSVSLLCTNGEVQVHDGKRKTRPSTKHKELKDEKNTIKPDYKLSSSLTSFWDLLQ